MTLQRMDALASERLEALLTELETEMADIKDSQIISGDNMRFTE